MGAAGADAIYADYTVARTIAEILFTVGSILTLGIGPALWGIGWLRSSGSSRWLGWTGIVTGVTGMVWFVWLIDNAIVGNVLILNVVVSLVLFAGLSVALVRRPGH